MKLLVKYFLLSGSNYIIYQPERPAFISVAEFYKCTEDI